MRVWGRCFFLRAAVTVLAAVTPPFGLAAEISVSAPDAMAQGERLEARGKWRKAEKIYHRELSSRLEDVRVYLALVRVYGGWNRLERGIAFFSERLHEGGSLRSLGALHYAMGLLYKAKGDPERAREEYLEAIELLGGKLELPEESGGT